jgi:cell division protein FtsB
MLRGSEPPTERASASNASPEDASFDVASAQPAALDLATMPIAGLTRGRLLGFAGLLTAAWIVFAFWRQVGAAGDLTDRADLLRAGNADLELRVAELEAELQLVQTPAYVALQARGYRLGGSNEVPFTIAADAPPLAADAPGSASTAVGAEPQGEAPIEAWLKLLFAPTD